MALRAVVKNIAIGLGLLCIAATPASTPSFVPVLQENFPDAFVLLHEGHFIAYSTNDGPNVPMATSPDLVRWSLVTNPDGKRRDAMPKLAPWAKTGFTWAPEVLKLGGKFLLYYTANYSKKDVQCIGVAVAGDPLGPFVDNSLEPLVCQLALGGSIDASPFRDSDGKLYLYYKSDGNRIGKHTEIWGQQLSQDGLSFLGQPVSLLHDDKSWEQRLVEAPTMVHSPAGYELFFSAAYFGWNDDQRLSPYGMGYATCAAALGPCTKSAESPILHSYREAEAGCLSGPGHQSIFQVGARTFMSFHAWAASSGCRKVGDKRFLYVAPLFWKDGKPQLSPSLR